MSLIEDLKLEEVKKNTPKMQYFKYKNEINEALKAGYTIKDIHNTLRKYDNVNISYEMLRFYISKSKNQNVKENNQKEKQINEEKIKEKPKKIYGRKDVLKAPVEKKLIRATIPDPKKLF